VLQLETKGENMPGPDPRKTKIKPLRQMTQQQKKALKQFKTKREDEKVSAMGGYKSGGRAGYKGGKSVKGNKFPDHSGDGKITKKDILMAKGIIPKTKKMKGKA
jgi:hypothetical protein